MKGKVYVISKIQILLLIFVLNPTLFVFAQVDPANLLPPSFIPKSPTVSMFPRIDGQHLVNLPTGAAQLSIPLTDVSCGSLHLPVALAYSYSGLKVAQPYDFVGVGWALQAGASITMQVNGLVDANFVGDPFRRYNPDSIKLNINNYNFLKRIVNNNADTGPDLYSFSLPSGENGRFILLDTTVVVLSQQTVAIRRIVGANYGLGFQIATENGIRYQFQAVEVTTPSKDNFSNIAQHASAWHLTRMISADNADTLRLHYTKVGNEPLPRYCTVTTGRHYTGIYELKGNTVSIPGSPDAACGSTAEYSFYNVQQIVVSRVSTQYLDSITTRGSSLRFTRETVTRGISQHGQELRHIQLLATGDGRQEIKHFTLYQTHFDAVNASTATDYRLRLDSLREGAPGVFLPAYRFSYKDTALPLRGSAAQDYWGYANGANGNGDVNTTTNPTLLADPRLTQGAQRAANREPDFSAAVAGALTQVHYPAGGSSQWQYEAGRIETTSADLNLFPLNYAYEYVFTGYDAATAQHITGGPRLPVTSSRVLTFQVTQATDVAVTLHRQPSDSVNTTGGTNTYRDFDIFRNNISVTANTSPSPYRILDGQGDTKTWDFHLLPGTYTAQVYCEIHEANSSIDIRIPYRDSTAFKAGLLGPGVRVAQTTTTAIGAPPLVHTYTYTFNGLASGQSLLPNFGRGFDSYINYNQSSTGYKTTFESTLCQYETTSSDNRGLGAEFNKYDFYYSAVLEASSDNQGVVQHLFTHLPQQFNDVVPVSQGSYLQNSGTSKFSQPVQQTTYAYTADNEVVFPLLRVRVLTSHSGDALYVDNSPFDLTQYELRTAVVLPTLTEQVRYDTQGKRFTTATYSAYAHQRLIRTATSTNSGWHIQRLKRLSDYVATPALTALRGNNFNPVIETQTWQRPLAGPDSVLVAGQLTLYDPTWRSPAQEYRLHLTQPVAGLNRETRTNGLYDNLLSDTRYELTGSVRYAATTGDLIEQRPAHGLPTSYLLGYGRTLVIAQAQHSSYAQLAYTSFEADATGRWRYDSTATSPRRQAPGRTGHYAYQLSGADVISRDQVPAGDYLLSYWLQGPAVPTLTLLGGTLSSPAQDLVAGPAGWHQRQVRVHFSNPGTVQLAAAGSGQPAVLDDLLLQPVGAQVSTYTHDPLVGETSQTGPDGRTLFFDYDGLGRLVRTRDEQGRILSQQQYHYAGK